jgi:hypothetical protein
LRVFSSGEASVCLLWAAHQQSHVRGLQRQRCADFPSQLLLSLGGVR